ncbi:uncharacterized protein [Rutidosis leptorrhynchoides]|uniref:uncharacterized protein n=1 Tax=Rutidosis leptorrhynchoides TaxID=125765 RepID=UPI003A99D58D
MFSYALRSLATLRLYTITGIGHVEESTSPNGEITLRRSIDIINLKLSATGMYDGGVSVTNSLLSLDSDVLLEPEGFKIPPYFLSQVKSFMDCLLSDVRANG